MLRGDPTCRPHPKARGVCGGFGLRVRGPPGSGVRVCLGDAGLGRKGSLFLPLVPTGECSPMSQAVLGPCVLPSWALRLRGPLIQCWRAASGQSRGPVLAPCEGGVQD